MLAVSMMNQARLRNRLATSACANVARPSVSTTPHTAMTAVSVRAVRRSGFLNIDLATASCRWMICYKDIHKAHFLLNLKRPEPNITLNFQTIQLTSIGRWFFSCDISSHQAGNQRGDIELTKYRLNRCQCAGCLTNGGNVAVSKRG
jgi:hypothetical protein